MTDTAKTYRAFISYSQQDKIWGKRLHGWLESYRVPAETTGDLAEGQRLGRFFRDDEEMAAAANIAEIVERSIDESESMIVICSPRSAQSQWVASEIERFRRRGRDGKVFAFIIDGVPNSGVPDTECFPVALRRRQNPDDELDLPFDAMRVKFGGGDNGHNGLRSIRKALGTGDFLRVRAGIGRPPGRQDPAAFVLKPFSSAERAELPPFLGRCADAVESLMIDGLERTQNRFND